jgi:tRNA(Leu) C34 or U34 (ribose-2'-O)-methylase TrmL
MQRRGFDEESFLKVIAEIRDRAARRRALQAQATTQDCESVDLALKRCDRAMRELRAAAKAVPPTVLLDDGEPDMLEFVWGVDQATKGIPPAQRILAITQPTSNSVAVSARCISVSPANIGAVFRSGAALGFDAVLLSPRCADPLYRRAIKVGMGAVFTMPWTRMADWHGALPDLSARGFSTVALTLAPDAVPIEDAVAGLDRVALVLGSEGHGLSARWEESADRRAIIPMAAGIDSLNVAAASAVACYVAARR